jgi:hypothetical protein
MHIIELSEEETVFSKKQFRKWRWNCAFSNIAGAIEIVRTAASIV